MADETKDPKAYPLLTPEGVPVPADQIQQYVAQGGNASLIDNKLGMVTPEGERRVVSGAEIRAALDAGYQIESAEAQAKAEVEARRNTLGQEAITFGEGVIESIPFVGAKLLDVTADDATKRAQQERAEVNPLARMAGQVGGTIAQTVATGGLGTAAKGAAVVGRAAEIAGTVGTAAKAAGALERVAKVATAPMAAVLRTGQAAGGLVTKGLQAAGVGERAAAVGGRVISTAVQGGLEGISAELADDELHDKPVTWERIAHAAATGALVGGFAEAALLGTGAIAGSLARRTGLSKVADPAVLDDFANEAAFNAIRARPADVMKLARPGEQLIDARRRLGQRLREAKIPIEDGLPGQMEKVLGKASTNVELVPKVEAAVDQAAAKLRAVKDEVSTLTKGRADLQPDVKGFLAKVDDLAKPFDESLVPAARSTAADIRGTVKLLRKKHELATVGELVPRVASSAERTAAQATVKELGKFTEIWRKNSEDLGKALVEDYQNFARKLGELVKKEGVAVPPGVDLTGLETLLKKSPKRFGEQMAADFDGFVATAGETLGGAPPAQRFDKVFGKPVTFDDLSKFRQDLADVVYPKKVPGTGLPPQAPPSAAELVQIERMAADEIAASGERALTVLGRDPGQWRAANREVSDWIKIKQLVDKAGGGQDPNLRSFSLSDNIQGVGAGIAAVTGMAAGHPTAALGLLWGPMHKVIRERGSAAASWAASSLAQALRSTDARRDIAVQALALGKSAREAVPLAAAYVASTTPDNRKPITASQVPETMAALRAMQEAPPEVKLQMAMQSLGDLPATNPRQARGAAQVMVQQAEFLRNMLPKPVKFANKYQPRAAKEGLAPIEQKKFESILRAVADPVSVLEDASRGRIDPLAIRAVRLTSPATLEDAKERIIKLLGDREDPIGLEEARRLDAVFELKTLPEQDLLLVRSAQRAMKGPQPAPEGGAIPPPSPEAMTRVQQIEQRKA